MSKKSTILIIFLLILSFAGGYFVKRGLHDHVETKTEHTHFEKAAQSGTTSDMEQVWTCSMHPQIRLPQPGKCPICGMTLIPVSTDSDADAGPGELKLSESARRLAEIAVAPVERKTVQNEIRMVGKVDYDETRLAYITSWIPGRLDRLFVDYTGVPVKKGDHLVYIYSPEILTAQEELLQAIETVKELEKSNVDIIRKTATATVEASREKLRLWGLTDEQIMSIENSGSTTDHITIYAPIGGIVIHKNAVEGVYVQTGTRIYTIADLTQVWVKLDAYESDLPWLRYGQEVEFYTEAYPGQSFRGRIAFIDPVLNEKTRTVKVRVNVPNTDGKLKPNMFVRGLVRANLASGGRVIDTYLAGKWISPMHPEIVKDEPGVCDICGMPLVKAEVLGFVTPDRGELRPPLLIPSSAPLITGKRAVVYVQLPSDPSRFTGRTVTLGPRAGDFYLVEDGLMEGELIVVNGNFKIDSALQIQAKPSMMSPEGGDAETGHHHHAGKKVKDESNKPATAAARGYNIPEAFTDQLENVVDAYFGIQNHLARDDIKAALNNAKMFSAALEKVDMKLLSETTHTVWMKAVQDLKVSAAMIEKAKDIEKVRMGFAELSEAMTEVVRDFGGNLEHKVVQLMCPMVFESRGATWLQDTDEVENPYFGGVMLRCGKIVKTLAEGRGASGEESHNHEGSHH